MHFPSRETAILPQSVSQSDSRGDRGWWKMSHNRRVRLWLCNYSTNLWFPLLHLQTIYSCLHSSRRIKWSLWDSTMPEITGLDKHLLRRGGPGWPLLSSTVVSVYCFSPSSIYSSVILNGSGLAGGRWRVRCDGSTKELVWAEMKSLCLAERSKARPFSYIKGERKHTHKHTPSCLRILRWLQGSDLPLCAPCCLCYNHRTSLANMIDLDMWLWVWYVYMQSCVCVFECV